MFLLAAIMDEYYYVGSVKHVADIAASPHSGIERVITHVSRGTSL